MQPVKMTRAQYEAQYGVKPVVSTSTFDTTPAPIRMTKAEYESKYGNIDQRGVLKRTVTDIPSDISQTASGFLGALKKGAQGFSSGMQQAFTSNPTNPEVSRTSQFVSGLVAPFSATANAFGEAAIGAAKVFTTPEFERAVAQKASEIGDAALNTELPGAQKTLSQVYESLDPQAKFTLSRLIAPTANVMTAAAVPGVGKGTAQAVEKAVTPLSEVASKLKQTVIKTPEQKIAKVADELANIESGYNKLRKNASYSKDIQGSYNRIAQSNVLEGAVNSDGVIDGLYAAKRYKETPIGDSGLSLKDVEDVVKRNLENEGKTVNLKEIESALKAEVFDAGLEGADLVTAINGLKNEINGLRLRADGLEDIPLAKLQDVKISTTDKINYATPPTEQVYRKAVARTYKNIIENKSNINVKEINSELAKFYEDIDRLKQLDGKRTKGGRLGKYQAALVGTGVGMAGGSLGGGLGAAAGGMLGGEIGAKMQGRALAKTFRTGLEGGLPENTVLKKAQEAASAGKKVDLRVPDNKLRAPANIARTPEISKIESQIANNVKQQRRAIKAGDFTLVAVLKDIYQSLVERLKTEVARVREGMKSEAGFANFFGGEAPKKYKKLSEREKLTVADALENYDTAPMTVKANGKDTIVDSSPDVDMRLEELKNKNARGSFTDKDAAEAKALLEDRGVL